MEDVTGHGTPPQQGDWWNRLPIQSSSGYLLKIEDIDSHCTSGRPKLTELLLYAITLGHGDERGRLPTPPPSSPLPDNDLNNEARATADATPTIVFRALPICSFLPELVGIHAFQSSKDGQMKPSFIDSGSVGPAVEVGGGKRRALTSVFENASRQRKKLKSKGGETVGIMFADKSKNLAEKVQKSNDDARKLNNQESLNQMVHNPKKSRLARSFSVSSAQHESALRQAIRPSLSLSKSSSQLKKGSSVASVLNSPIPIGTTSEIEQQNKLSLSRVVLAGMRIYGLQQRKKANEGIMSLPEHNSRLRPGDDEEVEEYKQVYHQTLKAALFAFRRETGIRLISPDESRETIDQLLAIFCTDRMSPQPTARSLNPSFGRDVKDTADVFDQPSSVSHPSNIHLPPTARKVYAA